MTTACLTTTGLLTIIAVSQLAIMFLVIVLHWITW